jgi:hypothetical protein
MERNDPDSCSFQATDLFDTILETQPRGGGGGGKSREDIVTEMCVDLLSKVSTPSTHPSAPQRPLLPPF